MGKKHKALLSEWQSRLGLTEWRIKLYPKCKPENMDLQDVCGCTAWEETSKTARVEILDSAYYRDDDRICAFDWEKTLVHELLHLKTCLVSSHVPDLQERYMHQMIDDLARAFVDAKRNGGSVNGVQGRDKT